MVTLMDEDEIRWMILEKLHMEYLKESHSYVMKDGLLKAQGILGLAENVLDRNVKYLEQKGLIDVKWYLGGGFMARINAFGVDAIEHKKDARPEARTKRPEAVLEDELDRQLRDRLPSLVDELAVTREQLAKGDRAIHFQSVAMACRNHFLDFAEAMYRPEFLPEGEEPPSRNQVKRKVRFTLMAVGAEHAERDLVESTVDQFEALVVFIHKEAHNKEADRSYAAACLAGLETAMLLILREVTKGKPA